MSSLFITKVRTSAGKTAARLLIESLQTFGGVIGQSPVWVFAVDPANEPCHDLASSRVEVLPLEVPAALQEYPFGDKVLACARAETLAPAGTQALIWIDLNCLVVRPPELFNLGEAFEVALRPVHMRNVGLPAAAPLDVFWHGIYAELGIRDLQQTVTSFIDQQTLRAYFNSHGLAVRPGLGLFQRWAEHFQRLVSDQVFQAEACPDARHQIFLFQALFSALVASTVAPERLRLLPPTYNYPYNLHGRVPDDRRAAAFNDLTCFTFEGRPIHPDTVKDIEIREPLRAWLAERLTAGAENSEAE